MKTSFAILLMVVAVAVGVIAMASLLPVNNGIQVGPMLTYGAVMFLCGVVSFALVLCGVMIMHDQLRIDLLKGEQTELKGNEKEHLHRPATENPQV